MIGITKDPVKVRAGQIGAEVGWRQPRVVRLDDLTGEQRRLVLTLLASQAASNKAAAA